MPIDVNELRKPFIDQHRLNNVDDIYTFFYDESNNFRKLYLTEEGFNIEKCDNFVLSGIALKGRVTDINYDELFDNLKLQKNVTEIKTKHLGKGLFLDFLNERKVKIFLSWLNSEDIYIHYFNLNAVYWSVVDIVDSIIEKNPHPFYYMYHMSIKSDLYKLIKSDEKAFFNMLRSFNYPNIKGDELNSFTSILSDFITTKSVYIDSFRRNILLSLCKNLKELDELFFIMNETDNILINNFLPFYVRTLYIFKNSEHIFDDEDSIEKIMHHFPMQDGNKDISNYKFSNSKAFKGIQVSDLVSGLLGKYFTFIKDLEISDMPRIKGDLNERQQENLELMRLIISKSDKQSRGFFNSVMSEDEYMKNDYFLHNVSRI
jgi:hypothetical protein